MVYSDVIIKFQNGCCLCCCLLSNVLSRRGRKDCVPPGVLKRREARGGNPCDEQWKFTDRHFIQVPLKLVLSLCMFLSFWYKSKPPEIH